jgi:hypothetical protein
MSIIAKGKPLLEEMRALLRRQGYAYGVPLLFYLTPQGYEALCVNAPH